MLLDIFIFGGAWKKYVKPNIFENMFMSYLDAEKRYGVLDKTI